MWISIYFIYIYEKSKKKHLRELSVMNSNEAIQMYLNISKLKRYFNAILKHGRILHNKNCHYFASNSFLYEIHF